MPGRHLDADGDGVADYAQRHPYNGAIRVSRDVAAPMGLNGSLMRAALASVGAVGKQIVSLDELAAGASDALRQAPDLTPAGAAGFLATCAVESAWFRTCTEYGKAGSLRYDPYRGRTFIQLTWESNYLGFGQWLAARGLVSDPRTFVNNPAALSDIRWAWLGAGYYMSTHGLWAYANRGQFRELSQGVNCGNGRIGTSFTPNGWAERQKAYAVFLAAGTALLPAASPDPTPAPYGELMQDKYPLIGSDVDIWDVACGSASFDCRRLFLGVTLFGGIVSGWVDFQNDKGGIGSRQTFNLAVPITNLSPRWVFEVPSGATKARIGWDATKAQKACLTITGGKS